MAEEPSEDAPVEAAGAMTEALETLERARGHLYSFHQLMGTADFKLDEAIDALRTAGHHDLADRVQDDLVGRNVLDGRWSFQVVEEFDEGYWSVFREHERAVRDQLVGGRRHLHESKLKERRRTPGRPGHESRPG